MTTPPPTARLPEHVLRFYYRQSLGEEKQASIPTQQGENHRCARALGFTDEQIAKAEASAYSDVNRSGGDFEGREDFDRLLREVRPGDTLITWKFDRMARDIIDGGVTIREIVQRRKCKVYLSQNGTAPLKCESAEDVMMVLFQAFGGQKGREDTRKNTRDGLRQRAREKKGTGPVPFGYRTVLVDPNAKDPKKTKKDIVKVPERVALVRRMALELYVGRNMGWTAITKLLNEEGIPSARGKQWARATVVDMLRDPSYVGHWSYGKTRAIGRKGKRTLRERAPDADVIRDYRPELAIFTPDEWSLLQSTIVRRHRTLPERTKMATALLSGGRLRCHCDRSMSIRSESKGKWSKRYYVCSGRRAGSNCDNATYLPAEATERQVVEGIQNKLLDEMEAFMVGLVREESARWIGAASARTGEAERIQCELGALKKARIKLIEMGSLADDVREIMDQIRANQDRANALERALAIATRPPVEPEMAARLEASVRAGIAALRDRLTTGEAREALTQMFPEGLKLARPTPGDTDGKSNGVLGSIEGAASTGSLSVVNASDLPFTTDREARIPFSLVLLAA